ncbi:hypothetical protein F5Y08DRAFT_222049 [Xylaria arbuscula]|nr:hypothetical protein F5Y08DRAFT_222049 [Xylaria arbuscula]
MPRLTHGSSLLSAPSHAILAAPSTSHIVGPVYDSVIIITRGIFFCSEFTNYPLVPVVVSRSGGAANSIPLGRNGFQGMAAHSRLSSSHVPQSSPVRVQYMVGHLVEAIRKVFLAASHATYPLHSPDMHPPLTSVTEPNETCSLTAARTHTHACLAEGETYIQEQQPTNGIINNTARASSIRIPLGFHHGERGST